MDESIAKGAVGTIKGLAQRAGQFTLRGLRYAPIFPVKVDGKKTTVGAAAIFNMPKVLGEEFTKLDLASKDTARSILGLKKSDEQKNIDTLS